MNQGRSLIVGIGNPLRSDDGVGHHVVQLVAGRLPPHAETWSVRQLLPEHAVRLAEFERVAFVDASLLDPPGECSVREIEPVDALPNDAHTLNPANLLGLLRWLGLTAPAAHSFAVGALSLDHGEGLTPEVTRAASATAKALMDWLAAGAGRLDEDVG